MLRMSAATLSPGAKKCWTDSDIFRLIELWQAERILWDVASRDFSNPDLKRAAMERISAGLGFVNVDDITRKMTSLRTQLGSVLRDMRNGSATGNPRRRWRFFDSMLFLREYIVPRAGVTMSRVREPSLTDMAAGQWNASSDAPDDNTGSNDFSLHRDVSVAGSDVDSQLSPVVDYDVDRDDDEEVEEDRHLRAASPAAVTASSATHRGSLWPEEMRLCRVKSETPTSYPGGAKRQRRESTASDDRMNHSDAAAAAGTRVPHHLQHHHRPKNGSPHRQSNATRLFCEMLYQQLMRIENEDDRELLQLELHGLVVRFRRRRLGGGGDCPSSYGLADGLQRSGSASGVESQHPPSNSSASL